MNRGRKLIALKTLTSSLRVNWDFAQFVYKIQPVLTFIFAFKFEKYFGVISIKKEFDGIVR